MAKTDTLFTRLEAENARRRSDLEGLRASTVKRLELIDSELSTLVDRETEVTEAKAEVRDSK